MIKYKLKWVSVQFSKELCRPVLVVPFVSRRVDWKYDKYITMKEASEILEWAVINPEEKNSILSQKDKANFGKQPLF